MKKAFSILLSFVMFTFVFYASPSWGQAKYGGSLIFSLSEEIKSIDPHKSATRSDRQARELICNTLVESGKNTEILPGLAKSWDISTDLKTLVFHLRKGVNFHNGRGMQATDVVWNLKRFLDPKTGGVAASQLADIESYRALDSYSVEVKLKNQSATIMVAFYTLPIIAHESVNEDGTVTHPIGTGPFVFEEWKPGNHFRVKKFNNYWEKGLPYLDKVELKLVPDPTSRLTALRTGDLDIASYLEITDVVKLMKKPNKKIVFSLDAQGDTYFLHFNVSKAPFNDKRVRQAVGYAINKEELNMGMTQGTGEIVSQLFPKSSQWYCDVSGLEHDPAKARALLKEAGYPDGLNVTIISSNQHPATTMAAIVQAQLKKIGINLKIELYDWQTFVGRIMKTDFIMATDSWSALADPGTHYPSYWIPGGRLHILTGKGYENPKMTKVLTQAGRIIDFEKRKALYAEAVKILVEDAPWILITVVKTPIGYGSYVKGFAPSSRAYFRYQDGGLHHTWLDR